MSELTPCNYCNLRNIKRRAAAEGMIVTTVPENDWIEVYVHPASVTDLTQKVNNEPSGYWVASMKKITDHCVC